MKKIIFILFILLNWEALAESDFSVKVVMRSYPVAAALIAEAGHAKKIWGRDSGPLYGYVRGAVIGQSSGVINAIGTQVEVFPISFFGLYAGGKLSKRDTDDLGTYNCDIVVCDGKMKRTYFGTKFALAFKGAFLFVDSKIEKVKVSNRAGVFAEETSTLLAAGGGDTLGQTTAILGYDLNQNLALGTLFQYNKMKNIKNDSAMALLITKIKNGKWSFLIGAGQFHSRQSTNHLSVMGMISWTGEKGLQLL